MAPPSSVTGNDKGDERLITLASYRNIEEALGISSCYGTEERWFSKMLCGSLRLNEVKGTDVYPLPRFADMLDTLIDVI